MSKMSQEDKNKALLAAMKDIDKSIGKGTLIRMGDKPREDIECISTTSLNLNSALGIGGIPKGRVIEIYGPESSGKTTLTLHIAAECQKEGGTVAFIDAEHALDPEYANNIGVDVDNLLISQPDFGEQALDVVDKLSRSGAVDLIIVDSVAALTPKVELEGEMNDQQVGVQARLMSKALRKLTAIISKTNTTIIFINQIRMKIGMMGYGSPETTTGGNALKFYASVRIDIRRIGSVKNGEDIIGNKTKAKVIKNKVAPPFKVAEFEIIFGKGISRIGEIIEHAVKNDIISKSGSWFSYGDTKIGQGQPKVIAFLDENPDILSKIEKEVEEILSPSKKEKKEVEEKSNSKTKKTTK